MLYNIKMNKISNKLHADLENNNELIVKVVKEKKNKSKKMDRNEKGEPLKKNGEVLKKNNDDIYKSCVNELNTGTCEPHLG
jgi:hypothetical protein